MALEFVKNFWMATKALFDDLSTGFSRKEDQEHASNHGQAVSGS